MYKMFFQLQIQTNVLFNVISSAAGLILLHLNAVVVIVATLLLAETAFC